MDPTHEQRIAALEADVLGLVALLDALVASLTSHGQVKRVIASGHLVDAEVAMRRRSPAAAAYLARMRRRLEQLPDD